MSGGSVITNADGQASEVGPINGIKISPAFNMGEDGRSHQKVCHEADSLQHERPLGHGQLELFAVVAFIRSPDRNAHQIADHLI